MALSPKLNACLLLYWELMGRLIIDVSFTHRGLPEKSSKAQPNLAQKLNS